jgi:mRNA interferase MazF
MVKTLRRGQFVTVALSGDYSKPRPALIVQSNEFMELSSVVVCPLSSDLRDDIGRIRVDVAPSKNNGLRKRSQVSIDKIDVLSTSKIGNVIGMADDELMLRVNRALAVFLGIV